MRYDDPKTRDSLAGAYALGTLRGAARKRFEALLVNRTDWRNALNKLNQRIHLLADTLPAVTPGKHVWRNIHSKLYGNATTPVANGMLNNAVGLWQKFAFGASGIAAVLAFLLINQSPIEQPTPATVAIAPPVETQITQVPTNVALLTTPDATAGWLVTLSKNKVGKHEIRVSAQASLKQANANSFELWLLPPDKSAPISLGTLPQQGKQQVVVSDNIASLLLLSGLAVSLEPIGGSPTGQPTGAVLYQGKLMQI